jgi:hypothetical protein
VKALSVLLLCAAVASGCARIRLHRDSAPPSERALEDTTYSTAIFGLKSFSDPVNLTERCPQGWSMIGTEARAFQGVLRVLTLNLYSPWTVKVSCRVQKARQADPF